MVNILEEVAVVKEVAMVNDVELGQIETLLNTLVENSVVEDAFVEIDGGITAPAGFKAAGVHCAIRKNKKDVAVITSDVPAAVGAVFTLSLTVAAPLLVDKIQLKSNSLFRAVVVNSGNANACTGERGLKDAWRMVDVAADALGIRREEVLISSTGVIGQYMPLENVERGIRAACDEQSIEGGMDAALAIMTTDTAMKEAAVELELGGVLVRIGAMAKGSGMIAPNMATMLAFLTTDAAIHPATLQRIFAQSVDRSFNRISVDGDTSTNDMAVILANGLAGNELITDESDSLVQFQAAIEHLVVKLAKMIARDGEGATKLVEVNVRGARSEAEAVAAARCVANSNLVKTAIHGGDANWGRIIAALGYSGVMFDPANVELAFDDLPILTRDFTIVLDEEKVKPLFLKDTLEVNINLNQGDFQASFWTCDLSKEYVHINASYRS